MTISFFLSDVVLNCRIGRTHVTVEKEDVNLNIGCSFRVCNISVYCRMKPSTTYEVFASLAHFVLFYGQLVTKIGNLLSAGG